MSDDQGGMADEWNDELDDATRDQLDEQLDHDLALLLAAPELWAQPSEHLENQIVAAIAAEARAGTVTTAHATMTAAPIASVAASAAQTAAATSITGAGGGTGTVVSLDAARQRRRRWLMPSGAALLGAAAAALVTVAVVPRDEGQPAADATITLKGTDLAVGVTGTADVTTEQSGVRIVIRAPGLPRHDGGEFYQGWLKSCDSSELIPIGSFHELDEAIGWAGIDIDGHPLLTVTKETVAAPKDPAQGSSGEVVVSGALRPCPPA